MKPSSGQMIREALEAERTKLAAEERLRILRLLEDLARAFYLAQNVQAQQGIREAIKTIERNS
jgi:aromatic ring hydroxylase